MTSTRTWKRFSGLSLRRVTFFFRCFVSVVIIFYLVTLLDWSRVWQVIFALRIEYLWIPPVLMTGGLFLAAMRWCILLPYFGVRLKRKDGFGLYLVATFYSNLLPGVFGGDVVRAMLCAARSRTSVTSVMVSVLVERTYGIVVLLSIPLVALALVPGSTWIELKPVVGAIAWIVGMVFGAAVGSWMIWSMLPRRLVGRIQMTRLAGRVNDIVSSLRTIPGLVILSALSLSAGFQLLDVVGTYFLARAMSLELPFSVFLLFIPLVYIATILPVSLGGVGVREGTLTFFLATVGVIASDAVMLALLVYLNRVLVGLMGGVVQILWHPDPALSVRYAKAIDSPVRRSHL